MKIRKIVIVMLSVILAVCCMCGGFVFPATAASAGSIRCICIYTSEYTAIKLSPIKASDKLYYTIDGSVPTTGSLLYTKPVGFESATLVRIAEFNKKGERVGKIRRVDVKRKCTSPKINVIDNLDGTADVYITNDIEGAEIHYTIDGSEPDISSPVVNGYFVIKGNAVIKAVTVKDGWSDSKVTAVEANVYVTQNSYNDYIQQALRETNAQRAANGIPALKLNVVLCSACAVRAKEVAANYENGHTRMNGTKWYTAISEAGYSFRYAAENYGSVYKSGVNPAEMVNIWMNSEGHKKNILDPNAEEVGFAFVQDGEHCYWVQLFATAL